MNPPSVEGWHTGTEWINSGSLMSRINFAAEMVGDTNRPGVKSMIDRIKRKGELSPEGFVDTCLDLMGPLEVTSGTREELIGRANAGGPLRWSTQHEADDSMQRVTTMLQLIVSLREFQYA
jgi:hypothetical protein